MTKDTTHTIALDDMSTEELVQLSQGLGHKIEQIREQRLHIRQKIDARLAEKNRTDIEAQIAELQGRLNGNAPGKVMTAAAKTPARKR